MFWRSLPLVGMLSIVLIAGCLRPWLQYRRHGTFGVLLFRSGRRDQNVRDALLVGLVALLIGQAVALAVEPRALKFAVGRRDAPQGLLEVAGAVLLFGGIALMAAAQLNLGASWRIGIKEGDAPGLVVGRLYRFCRHPIYLGLLMAIAGYAALLPTGLSLALLAATYGGVRVQAAAEEAYLERTYGEAWRAYARRTGRLLLGLGRLSSPPLRTAIRGTNGGDVRP
jgi:protein-S-isoprenylcysteine O-methyltransferase Ste14